MQHAAHDSALSLGSSSDAGSNKVRELEDEVRYLAEKTNSACKPSFSFFPPLIPY